MLYCGELVLGGDFQAFVCTCLAVIVLSVSPRINGTPPESNDFRHCRLGRKSTETTLKTGRFGWRYSYFPPVRVLETRREGGKNGEEGKGREAAEGEVWRGDGRKGRMRRRREKEGNEKKEAINLVLWEGSEGYRALSARPSWVDWCLCEEARNHAHMRVPRNWVCCSRPASAK